jgi:hypothetical protein
MANILVTAHGGRMSGTSLGTYVVPKGVTIYFFVKDGQLMNSDASDVIMDNLCTANPNEAAVQALAVDVKRQYENVPDYIASGTDDFRDPTGIYTVGQSIATGLYAPIQNGSQFRLSEIIGGQSSGGVIGSVIYWLACRAKPQSWNNWSVDVATTLPGAHGKVHLLGGNQVGQAMGLKPSLVKATGSWQ